MPGSTVASSSCAPADALPASGSRRRQPARRRPGRCRLLPAIAVRRPADAPFLLELGPVGFEELKVFLLAELAHRGAVEVMDERAVGADQAVARTADAHGEIIVFEHPDAEALIEQTDLIQHPAGDDQAEETQP